MNPSSTIQAAPSTLMPAPRPATSVTILTGGPGAARKVIGATEVPEVVTSKAAWSPASAITTSPGPTVSAACCSVPHGWPSVPGLPSLPPGGGAT